MWKAAKPPVPPYYRVPKQLELRMAVQARNLVLTESQAACLIALRHHQGSKSGIAIAAKLDLKKAETGLGVLERLGLAAPFLSGGEIAGLEARRAALVE